MTSLGSSTAPGSQLSQLSFEGQFDPRHSRAGGGGYLRFAAEPYLQPVGKFSKVSWSTSSFLDRSSLSLEWAAPSARLTVPGFFDKILSLLLSGLK